MDAGGRRRLTRDAGRRRPFPWCDWNDGFFELILGNRISVIFRTSINRLVFIVFFDRQSFPPHFVLLLREDMQNLGDVHNSLQSRGNFYIEYVSLSSYEVLLIISSRTGLGMIIFGIFIRRVINGKLRHYSQADFGRSRPVSKGGKWGFSTKIWATLVKFCIQYKSTNQQKQVSPRLSKIYIDPPWNDELATSLKGDINIFLRFKLFVVLSLAISESIIVTKIQKAKTTFLLVKHHLPFQ